MFGEYIKNIRENKGLLQREVAAFLEVDTAFISKIERNEKSASRNHLPKLSELFNVSESEIIKYWLADKVYQVISDEDQKLEILKVAEEKVKYNQKTSK